MHFYQEGDGRVHSHGSPNELEIISLEIDYFPWSIKRKHLCIFKIKSFILFVS